MKKGQIGGDFSFQAPQPRKVEMNVDGVKIAIRPPLVNKVDALDIANSKIFECLSNHPLADISENVGNIEADVSDLRRHF